MNSVFSEQILADKLSKLNNTQQCIENSVRNSVENVSALGQRLRELLQKQSLSHWCIFHRKNAEQVVQTWDKQFHSSQKEQKIPFLYLANDILQNSKRTGSEFVGEFWKVLPAAVKDVNENGDDYGKNVVSRLVNIWEERRVFGSRAQGLKDLMFGSETLPELELNKKRSRSGSVKIMRRDSRSLKLKLSIGGTAEKIVSALHTVLSEHHSEDTDLSKCKATVRRLEKIEKDVEIACARVGDPRRVTLTEEIQEEETLLKQCIEKIKLVEANREALVSQLKETLQEQESQLESVRTQLQVAQGQVEQAENMRRRLNNEPVAPLTNPTPAIPNSNGPSSSSADTSKKTAAAIAAEVADKLAASTHSQQIMTSVLSTFAAEAKNAGSAGTANASNVQPKSEKPMPGTEQTTTFVPVHSMPQAVLVHQAPMQNQVAAVQPQYNIYAATTQQYLQPSGGMMIGLPYAYTAMPTPPPPPPPPQMMNLARPAPLLQQQPMAMMQQPVQPQPMPQQMMMQPPPHMNQQQVQFGIQQPAQPSYRPLQAPGMGFYHQQTQ